MENQNKDIYIFFLLNWEIFIWNWEQTYFLALGMGPNFGPKNWVTKSHVLDEVFVKCCGGMVEVLLIL